MNCFMKKYRGEPHNSANENSGNGENRVVLHSGIEKAFVEGISETEKTFGDICFLFQIHNANIINTNVS